MRNLEAKFKLFDLEKARKRAGALGYVFKASLHQRDTFFRVQHGRLKLREDETGAALIYYSREEKAGLQLSRYEIFSVAEPDRMRDTLTQALGVLGDVKKERALLERGNVRLHLDQVSGLGDFGEIEAALCEDDDLEPSRRAVEDLLAALDVRHTALIGASYLEMLRPVK